MNSLPKSLCTDLHLAVMLRSPAKLVEHGFVLAM
jgi:hypothetical protein